MGTRSLVAWAATLVVSVGFARAAYADARGDIAQKSREAMESYDLMDYEAAKKLLNQGLAAAKKAKLDKDPLAAKLYVFVGIASFASGDPDGAKLAFLSAVQIDPKIQIEAAYKSPELVKLLEQAKAEASGGGSDGPSGGGGGVDCTGVKGLRHDILDTGKGGVATSIEALVGGDLSPARVSVMYRSEGATEFVEGKLTRQGECRYTGAIPAAAMRGSLLHYYVAAYDGNNRVIASKGSSGSPNIMEVTAGKGGAIKPDDEDPINGGGKRRTPIESSGGGGGGPEGEVSGGVVVGGKPAKVYIAVSGGTGFGYVTGKTEFDNMVENCCIGNSLVVVTPEIGFYANPQLSIGVAARLGLPVGANIEGHSTVAPSAVLRVRYALNPSGEGLRVMGQLGGGILRNTIKLNNAMDGADTDIVAQGPLLIGAGIGFTKRLSGNFSFVADLSALGAIAVVDKLGTTPNLNNGLAADLSVGFAVGF